MKSILFRIFTTVLLLLNALSAKASTIKAETCVSLREEPNISSPTIACLQSGEYVEVVVRNPRSGSLAWVEDSEGRIWWKIQIPSQNIQGWVISQYVDL